MEPALKEDLFSPKRQGLIDLLSELVFGQNVAVLRGQVPVEGAKRALSGADVRVVDIAVDDVGDEALRVQAPAHRVGEFAQGQEVRVLQ